MGIILLNQADIPSIDLYTRLGNKIENEQCTGYTPFELNQFKGYIDKYKNSAIFKYNPVPWANCHGYTFASSRTTIWDSEEVKKILHDDNYIEIKNYSDVKPGDVILYFDNKGDIVHSGIIISEYDSTIPVPKVVGRWSRFGEAVHFANNCPYNFSNAKYYRITK